MSAAGQANRLFWLGTNDAITALTFKKKRKKPEKLLQYVYPKGFKAVCTHIILVESPSVNFFHNFFPSFIMRLFEF